MQLVAGQEITITTDYARPGDETTIAMRCAASHAHAGCRALPALHVSCMDPGEEIRFEPVAMTSCSCSLCAKPRSASHGAFRCMHLASTSLFD